MAEQARRFRFLRCLGAGGFGEVYLASMRSVGGVESEVAVKVLHDGLDPRSQAVQRLRDEARILGTLNHPAVLTVHDLVLLGGRVALVMEYVPGIDLEECLTFQPPIPARPSLEAVARVADAMAAALVAPNSVGQPLRLVHRDIKPSNIRIGRHGQVKLLDFGIAKAADATREAKTQTRLTMGSPWYMAPERFDYVSDDPASDVYALGCVLYETFASGVRLMEQFSPREHFRLAMDDRKHDAHVAGRLAPLPAEVRGILVRMLAFETAARPTVASLVPELEDLAERSEGAALPRWCRELTWPADHNEDGALVGREITEQRLSGFTAPTPAPAPAAAFPGTPVVVPGSASLPTFDPDKGGSVDPPARSAAATSLEYLDSPGDVPADGQGDGASQPDEPPQPEQLSQPEQPSVAVKSKKRRRGSSPVLPVTLLLLGVGVVLLFVMMFLGFGGTLYALLIAILLEA